MTHQGSDETVPPGYVPNQYTRCPYCMAVFRVNKEKLSAREGDVRCGACREVFNALDHAVEADEEGGFRRLTRQETTSAITGKSIEQALEIQDDRGLSEETQGTAGTEVGATQSGSDSLLDKKDDTGKGASMQDLEITQSLPESGAASFDPESVVPDSTEEDHAYNSEGGDSSSDSREALAEPDSDSIPSLSQPDNEVDEVEELPFDESKEPAEVSADKTSVADSTGDAPNLSEDERIVEAASQVNDLEPSSPDYESTNSIDVISAYAQDPEWDKEWQEFSLQEVESTVLDSYMEHRSGSVLGDAAELNDSDEHSSHPRNWFNAEPDSLLDNNPFPSDPAAGQTAGEPKPSLINMGGVDQFIMDRPHPLASIFWFFVAAGFVVLLGLQVKYFFVERFAQDDRYRSYLSLFCKVARCELPPRRDAYQFTITNTRIDLHPEEPGALRITVKLLNQATFEQPYPELQLTLTDRVGRVVGRRVFEPEFYLSVDQYPQLAPGELGAVTFDLARPHEKAVGFVVDIVHRPAA